MRTACFAALASFAIGVSAHFQLQYPEPRGPFVEDDEPKFCGMLNLTSHEQCRTDCFGLVDNYVNAVSNRTAFPLSGGYIILNSEHTSWTCKSGKHIFHYTKRLTIKSASWR